MAGADTATGAVERGRAAYRQRAWADACEALIAADGEAPLGTDDLWLLAWSHGLCGRDAPMFEVLERVYQAHVDAGERALGARAAFWLGFRLGILGEQSRASAWLTRGERLLEDAGCECAEHGYLLLPQVRRYLAAGNDDAAYESARTAAEIGARCGDLDLCVLARNIQGRVLIRQGQLESGMKLLDETMLAVTAGEISPILSGLIYCAAIDCCHGVQALDRAREWTASLAGWCDAQPQLLPFTGECMVYRAELLQLGGSWPEAIEEARRAAQRFVAHLGPQAGGHAIYQEAEIHRLRGELEAAEEGYRNASRCGREPQPGLALLRLAQGRGDVAVSALRRVLDTMREPLARARVLPAYVEVLLAVGEIEEARRASRELDDIASRYETDVLRAIAARARGEVSLAEGDARGAVSPLREAFDVWLRVGAPYLAARTRLALGRAYHALGDADGASLEIDAARAELERLGAVIDAAKVDAPSSTTKAPSLRGLTARELEVLRLVAAGKTNKRIGRELGLSEKTVDRHVSNILAKLDVHSRAAATAFAYEHKLV